MQGFVDFNEAAKCKEETDKDLPFTPDKPHKPVAKAGKYGSAYSTVRHLARQAMQKQAKKSVKEEGGKITVDEETLIEKLDKKEELRAALDRHTQKAIEANRRGDDEAVKTHQTYINKIKDKMTKLVRNEEVEQIDEISKSTAKSYVDKKMDKIYSADKAPGKEKAKRDIQSLQRAHERIVGNKPTSEEVELDEEKIPVQHATDSVGRVLGNKSAVKFLTHLRPGAEKHTSWDKINTALTNQGVKSQHIAKIASHVKPAQYKEEAQLDESSDAHKVMVTVSDPNHPAVSQRKEQIMKHVIVRAGDKGDAQAKAEAFYKKKGYKVHGSEYHSKQPATSVKTEEKEMENMKTFTQFMEELEQIQETEYGWDVPEKKEKPVSNVRRIAGKAYGGAAQKDDEDEDHPVANKATEKRGRGRPKGSTSGARTAGAAKKSYGGLAFHTLSLPNSNK